jgi:6-phosphogluconate dehydrogenase
MIYIVMGVTGSGKTTIGKLLAGDLGLPFYDADDFHSDVNIQKMAAGTPLTDEDRQQWLETLAINIKNWSKEGGAVLACSALKEKYRRILQSVPADAIKWILLKGDEIIIRERMAARKDHFMSPNLLQSQVNDLEVPEYGIHFDVSLSAQEIVQKIIREMDNPLAEFGFIGMGVMGSNLALNLASQEIAVAIYNRHVPGIEEGMAQKVVDENRDIKNLKPFDDLQSFVSSIAKPRKILLMIKAGEAVEMQLKTLAPLLSEGDVVIDGGNSYFKDSERRFAQMQTESIHFLGVGISGGEEGARNGAAMMAGGSIEGYKIAAPYLELMSAKDKNGAPCVGFTGAGGAGHFIKMVHNSIEYAEMQAIADVYFILKQYLKLSPENIVEIFRSWEQDGCESYLLTITQKILQKKEGDDFLLDLILDQAEQKGTGNWSATTAIDLGIPYGPLMEAVMARSVSARKKERNELAGLYAGQSFLNEETEKISVDQIKHAYKATRIINHHIGFDTLQNASEIYNWNLPLPEIARIWTNGCIIRSSLMEELVDILADQNILLKHPSIADQVKFYKQDFITTITSSLQNNIVVPVLTSALNYFLSITTADSSANLIQAQRDYFGAHTYKRKDRNADEYFHTKW